MASEFLRRQAEKSRKDTQEKLSQMKDAPKIKFAPRPKDIEKRQYGNNPVIGKEMKINYAPRPNTAPRPNMAPRPSRSIYTGFDPKVKVGTTGLLPRPRSNEADFRLTPQQRLEKYNQVLHDKSMDYNKKKELIRAGQKTLGSMVAQGTPKGIAKTISDWVNPFGKENLKPEEIRRASDLSVGLQQQLKSAAFGAGLLDSVGFGMLSHPVKSPVANQVKRQVGQIQKNNPKHYTGGEVAGEFAKAGAMYGTVGAMAEKGVSKIPIIAKGMQGISNPKVQKLAKFGAGILGQQAADTVVNTPLTILRGVQDGKNGGQIGKNVMKQQEEDFGFNLALGGGSEAIQYLKKWNQENVVNKGLKVIDQNYGKMKKDGFVLDGVNKEKRLNQLHATGLQSPKENSVSNFIDNSVSDNMKNINANSTGFATGELVKSAEKRGGTVAMEMEKSPKQAFSISEPYREAGETAEEYKKFVSMNDPSYWQKTMKELEKNFDGGKTAEQRSAFGKEFAQKESEFLALREKFVPMTKRGSQFRQKGENALMKELSNTFGIHTNAEKDVLKELVSDMGDDFFKGTLSQEKAETLLQKAYGMGKQVDDSGAEYKDLKNNLKHSKLSIHVTDATSIPDFDAFRKSQFGKIGSITTKGDGISVDSKYRELSEMYPEIFPESITHPADQLLRISDALEGLKKKETPLNQVFGQNTPVEMRGYFDDLTERFKQDLSHVEEYNADRGAKAATREIKEEKNKILSSEELIDLNKKLYTQQNRRDKMKSKMLLTVKEKYEVEGLAKGIKTIDEVPPDMRVDMIQSLAEAEKSVSDLEETISMAKTAKKDKVGSFVKDLISGSDLWKEKKSGLPGLRYARETMERNMRDVVLDKEEAERIVDGIFTPIHENTAKATKFKNVYRQRVKELSLHNKKIYTLPNGEKASERQVVQYLGEMEYEIRKIQGKTSVSIEEGTLVAEMEKVVRGIRSKFTKETTQKMNHSIEVFQQIYKEIHPKINKVMLENGYAPVGYIEGYFPHFLQDVTDSFVRKIGESLGFKFDSRELPMDIAGMTQSFKPGKPFSSNLLKREGKATDYDAVLGFDQYIENIGDIIYHTDDIQKLREMERQLRFKHSDDGIKERVKEIMADVTLTEEDKYARIEKIYEDNQQSHLPHLVQEIREYTNLLAGKKSSHDRSPESDMGRTLYTFSKAVENSIATNMVAVNPGSWLTNVIPVIQAGEVSTKSIIKGMAETVQNFRNEDDLFLRSAFLVNRKGSDAISKTSMERTAEILTSPMGVIDRLTSGALVRGRYYDNVKKGMDGTAAMRDADKFVASVIADRSKGALPTLFERRSPGWKALTMFQLEVNNQLSYIMKDLPRNTQGDMRKRATTITKMLIGAYIFNDFYESLTGRRSALDPISWVNDAIGDVTGAKMKNTFSIAQDGIKDGDFTLTREAEKKNPFETVVGFGGNMVEQLPVVGGLIGGGRLPISSAMPDPEKIGNHISTLFDEESDPKAVWRNIGKGLIKPALLLGPPFGGGQIQKIAQGYQTIQESGSYRTNNKGERELEFPMEDRSPLRQLQAMTFGKYAVPEAKGYVDSGFKKLSGKDTEKYQKAIQQTGIAPSKYLDVNKDLKEYRTDAQKTKYLINSDLTVEQKEFFLMEKIKDFQKEESRKAFNDSIWSLKNNGLEMDDILDIFNEKAYFEKKYKNKIEMKWEPNNVTQKANDFVEYLQKKGISSEQIKTMKDTFEIGSATIFDSGYEKVGDIVEPSVYAKMKAVTAGMKNVNGIMYSGARNKMKALEPYVSDMGVGERYRVYEAFGISKRIW